MDDWRDLLEILGGVAGVLAVLIRGALAAWPTIAPWIERQLRRLERVRMAEIRARREADRLQAQVEVERLRMAADGSGQSEATESPGTPLGSDQEDSD